MAKHEQTIEQHVNGNVMTALDQAHEYPSLIHAGLSYMQNTRDRVREDGYSDDEAFDAQQAFIFAFNRRAGVEL